MSKRPIFGSQFEKLRALGAQKSLDEQKAGAEARSHGVAPESQLNPLSPILGQSLSTADTVENEPCLPRTLSSTTGATIDPVINEPREKRRGSRVDPVHAESSVGFTKVPHALLRGECRFSEPLDFMVYLHLFTYSHGFGRREADMSQAQLGKFTGAAKNTIKRSLDRLEAEGWIKCIQEFECARISRRWMVFAPEDRSGKPGRKGKKTVSNTDTVHNVPSPLVTESGSTADPLTGSKIAPYKERDPKEKSKNSLSPQVPALRDYFVNLKPFRKRESEWSAYQGLRIDYGEEQIAVCFEYLRNRGISNTGTRCHSPMGFLAKAMGQVLTEAQGALAKRMRIEAAVRADSDVAARRVAEEDVSEREAQIREHAFKAAFPDSVGQNAILAQYIDRFPMLGRDGPVFRKLAIATWWAEERQLPQQSSA